MTPCQIPNSGRTRASLSRRSHRHTPSSSDHREEHELTSCSSSSVPLSFFVLFVSSSSSDSLNIILLRLSTRTRGRLSLFDRGEDKGVLSPGVRVERVESKEAFERSGVASLEAASSEIDPSSSDRVSEVGGGARSLSWRKKCDQIDDVQCPG